MIHSELSISEGHKLQLYTTREDGGRKYKVRAVAKDTGTDGPWFLGPVWECNNLIHGFSELNDIYHWIGGGNAYYMGYPTHPWSKNGFQEVDIDDA